MNRRPYQILGESLRQEIFTKPYSAGEKLPAEREIAEKMQVSRATVRDAMIMLELEGLVEVRKGSGIYITENAQQKSQTPPLNQTPDIGPFELLQARQLIESHIAEFAASQITIHDIKRLDEALRQQKEQLECGTKAESPDRDFHFAIADATQNTALSESVKQLWRQRESSKMWQVLHSHITDQSYQSQWHSQHERIFFALKKKNPAEARHAMWEHLESVKQTLLTLADADDPAFDGYMFSASPSPKTGENS